MNESLRKGINHFVIYTNKMGLLNNEDLADTMVCMKYEVGKYCDIVAVPKDSPELKNYDLVVEFPKLPEDSTEAMIDLAGFLSVRLSGYVRAKKASDKSHKSLTSGERSERAKKAASARWKKEENKPSK